MDFKSKLTCLEAASTIEARTSQSAAEEEEEEGKITMKSVRVCLRSLRRHYTLPVIFSSARHYTENSLLSCHKVQRNKSEYVCRVTTETLLVNKHKFIFSDDCREPVTTCSVQSIQNSPLLGRSHRLLPKRSEKSKTLFHLCCALRCSGKCLALFLTMTIK